MKNCAFCSKEFEATTKRLCCTRSCSAKMAIATKGKTTAWTEKEIDFLESNLGSLPFKKLVSQFRKEFKKNRTHTAIEVKIHRLTTHSHLSRKCVDDNFTTRELARSLGLTHDRIRYFVRNNILPYKRVSRNQIAIKRSDAKKLVKQYPERFADVDRSNLLWLLESEKDVDFVLGFERHSRGFKRRVLCVTTGIVYSGVKEAARQNYVSHGCISQAISRGGKSAGKEWRWID